VTPSRTCFAAAIAVPALLLVVAAPALAADITLLSPGAMMSSLKELIPQFQAASGHKVTVTYSPALAIADRTRKDDAAATVVIVGEGSANALDKLGKLAAGSKTVIARVGVGVFVRRGDPKPDISTVDAFTRALTTAKVIAYSDPALGGSASNYVNELVAKLDITGSIKPRVKLATQYRSLANFVATGGADFGLNQITGIRADARLELVGPLPAPLQRYTSYVAGVVATADNQSAGRALIDFLASPAASNVMQGNGFEPR
jgi:molybdate transport system substrate-binding protein